MEAKMKHMDVIAACLGKIARMRGVKMSGKEEARAMFLESKERFSEALQASSDNPYTLRNYADATIFYSQDDLEIAEEYYTKAVEADPEDSSSLHKYAVFLEKNKKDLDKAELYFKKSLVANPHHVAPLMSYGHFLVIHKGEVNKAKELLLTAVLHSDPSDGNPVSHYALFLWKHMDDLDGAEEMFLKAISTDPANHVFNNNYGTFLQTARGDTEKSLEYMKSTSHNRITLSTSFTASPPQILKEFHK